MITQEDIMEQIVEREKILERLRGYACGHHKQLESMILNQINRLKCRHIEMSRNFA